MLKFQLDEEKKEHELKLELERAEQRTVHYEEIRVRIGLMEQQLAKIVARGDSVKFRFLNQSKAVFIGRRARKYESRTSRRAASASETERT